MLDGEELAVIVSEAVQKRNSKWRLIYSEAGYLDLVRKRTDRAMRQQRHFDVIALITPGLKKLPRFSNVKGAFVKRTFMELCSHVDVWKSTVGVCQR